MCRRLPAPVIIDSTRGDVAITPAAAGYTLDATATDGYITIDDTNAPSTGSDDEHRASGTVRAHHSGR